MFTAAPRMFLAGAPRLFSQVKTSQMAEGKFKELSFTPTIRVLFAIYSKSDSSYLENIANRRLNLNAEIRTPKEIRMRRNPKQARFARD